MKVSRLPSAEELSALDEESGLDLLFDAVDDALWAGHDNQDWSDIERWLKQLDPNDLSSTLIVGVLSTTLSVKHLASRKRWFEKAEAVFYKRCPDRAHRILRGLL